MCCKPHNKVLQHLSAAPPEDPKHRFWHFLRVLHFYPGKPLVLTTSPNSNHALRTCQVICKHLLSTSHFLWKQKGISKHHVPKKLRAAGETGTSTNQQELMALWASGLPDVCTSKSQKYWGTEHALKHPDTRRQNM